MAAGRLLDPLGELLERFDHSARVSEHLVGVLPKAVWQARPPGGGRSIAAIVAHMQSVRRTFAKMGGAGALTRLDRTRSTPAQARRALRESRMALNRLFRESLENGRARVKGMPRRTVDMMLYLVQHDAHHRGQITAIVRSLGQRLEMDDLMRIWGWKRLP